MTAIMFQQLVIAVTTNQVLTAFILVVIAIVLFVTHKLTRTKVNLPPGPTPLPIIGNLHQIIADGGGRVAAERLRKKYGDICTVKVGPSTCILISSYKLIKEAFVTQGDAFLGRPLPFPCFRVAAFKGILFSDGQGWKNQRRFALRHLRELGFGKVAMEENIHTEAELLLDAIRDENGKLFDIGPLVQNAVSNITCMLLLGHRFSYMNDDFKEVMNQVNEAAKSNQTDIGRYFPSLLYLPFGFKNTKHFLKQFYTIKQFIREEIKEHVASFDPDSIRDLIDVYIKGGLEFQGGVDGTIFEEEEVTQLMYDLFNAGTETTTSVIRWGLLYLMLHQDVQERLRQEIRDVVGSDRLPSVHDKAALHYTEAVTTEILRLSNLIPFPGHRVTKDVKLCGYDIPANATIIANLGSATLDENDFPEPHEFRPQRFLDENGHFTRGKQERVISFGMGKRDCIGKSLAKTELFLFFTSMIQRFHFYLPETKPFPSMIGSDGLVHSPDPYLMYAVEV